MTLAPDVADDDFLGWLAAADVVVDLRFPHRGEVSGSLARAMQAGRPAVVSATGHLPRRAGRARCCAWRRVRPTPRSWPPVCAPWWTTRALRAPDGCGRARPHGGASATSEATAHGYEQAVDATLALIGDPAHKALAIWGKALADLGVDEHDLARGLGLEYARALEDFERTP